MILQPVCLMDFREVFSWFPEPFSQFVKSWGSPSSNWNNQKEKWLDFGGIRLEPEIWTTIWMFPIIGVPQNGWFIMENLIKMDDLEVPLFLETPIYQWQRFKWMMVPKSFRTFELRQLFFGNILRYFAARASDLYNASFKVTEFIFKVMMINKSHDYRTPWYTVWCTCVPFWCNKTNSWSHDASSPNLLITKETQNDWNNTPLKINMEHNNES